MATQTELAMKLGVSQQFLSRWKRGKVGIRKATAVRWGKILKIKPEQLVFADVQKRPSMLGLSE